MDFSGRAAFAEHLYADLFRLISAGMGIVLIMVVLRVAYLRATSTPESDRRKASPAAMASYALFAAIPTWESLARLGLPLLWPRAITYAIALALGVYASFTQVSYSRSWRRHPHEKGTRRRADSGHSAR